MTWFRSFASSFASASDRRQWPGEPVAETEVGREERERDFHLGLGAEANLGLLGDFANAA
jgi:hypothetical protein